LIDPSATHTLDACATIIRNQLQDPVSATGARCIYYRRDDKNAQKGSGREHYQLILSSPGMMDDAVECGPTGHGADGVHKSVEDDIIVDAVMGYVSAEIISVSRHLFVMVDLWCCDVDASDARR
jgi:hypothetical protein